MILQKMSTRILIAFFLCVINALAFATQNVSLYVRESKTVVCESLPYGYTVYACNFASPSTAITTYSVGNHGGYIKVNSFFTGSVSVQCDQYYYYYVGNFRYAGHRTTYFVVTCKPINITLSSTYKEMTPDSYYNITYTSNPSNSGYNPEVTWQSSNLSVAQVSSTGRVHAIAPGTATITAHNGSGPDKTCTVVVQSPSPTSITVTPGILSFPRGQSRSLSHSVTPSNASYTLIWTSSNTSVATVSNGTVYGVAPGNATITARISGTSITDICNVTVQPINPTSITINHTKTVNVGQNVTIGRSVTPSNADYSITWTSSNNSVATVSDGVVHGVDNGMARITARITGTNIYDTCCVTVVRPTLGLTSTVADGWVTPGTTVVLTATDNTASIRYTTDGSIPTQSSTLYTGPITVTDSLTLKAIAYHANYYPSQVLTRNYKVNNFQVVDQAPEDYTISSLPTIPMVTFNKLFTESLNYADIKLYTGSSVSNVITNGVEVAGEKYIVGNTFYYIPTDASSGVTRTYRLHIPSGALLSEHQEPNWECTVFYTVDPHVSSQSVQGISLDSTDDNLTMSVGGRHIMNLMMTPVNGAYDTIYWSVANPSVVSVSQYGVVDAISIGSTTVSVTVEAGSSVYSATSHIIVTGNLSVSTTVGDDAGGRVSGSGLYTYLSQASITAEANPCYHFVQWNDGDTTNPRILTVTQDTNFTAIFAYNEPVIGYDTVTACDSYTWDGNTYNTSGTYIHNTTNAEGCDSTVTLHLTIHNSSTSPYVSMRVCDSTVLWGQTFSEDSVISHTMPNANRYGCDSTARVRLYVIHTAHTSSTVETCDSYYWHYHNYTETPDTLPIYRNTDWNGCTSTDTLHLTIHQASSSIETIEACDSAVWHGTKYTYSANWPQYKVPGGNIHGCDSVVHLNLTIHRSTTRFLYVTETRSTYQWNDSIYSQSGIYTWVGTTEFGCDSTVILHLTLYGQDNAGIHESMDSEPTIVAYPSPTKGFATIKTPSQITEIIVYNMNGIIVQHLKDVDTIDLTGMSSGVYIVKVSTTNGSKTIKIIKE